MVYIGLNLSEITAWECIPDILKIKPKQIFSMEVSDLLRLQYISCFEMNHAPVLDILKRRFGITVSVPERKELHKIHKYDKIIIVTVTKVRHLDPEERYTKEELVKAGIYFRMYEIK